MLYRINRFRCVFISLLLILGMTFFTSGRGMGYIMPAEQIIDFMAKNFSKFKTLIFTQSTQQQDEEAEGDGRVFEEKIWMKSPSFFHSEVIDRDVERAAEPASAYRQLLIANNGQRLSRLLSKMGIDVRSVAFTRIDGQVAYRIGDKEPDSPKILIEKDRFLPLLLIYRLPGQIFKESIRVRFKDYRKMDRGWYPFEIIYFDGQRIREVYTIQTLRLNVPIDKDFFASPRAKVQPGEPQETPKGSPEEERLKDVIKKFEEKYR